MAQGHRHQRLRRRHLRARLHPGRIGVRALAEARLSRRTTNVAVIAHAGKSLGGGLPALRRALAAEGVTTPFWAEVPKSRKAPAQVRRALGEGAETIFVWGGDGMVQRCIDVLAGSETRLAIVPAGTANLFATNLGIPASIDEAVAIGLHGTTRTVDVGRLADERFAVMAGVGFDASMIRGASGRLKGRIGKAAYLWTGLRAMRTKPFRAKIKVDGAKWYDGNASCILVGNMSQIIGGVTVFEGSRPDDGLLELGVVNAEGVVQWSRTLARAALGTAGESPFVRETKARSIRIKLGRKIRYELDGGDRGTRRRLKIVVEPAAVTVCVPQT